MFSPRDLGFTTAISPTPPNFYVCDPGYGINLEPSSCVSVLSGLPSGKWKLPYAVDTSGARYALPWSMAVDDCRVSVELAGPVEAKTYMAKPDDIRGVADWLVNQCVSTEGGIGGFVTKDIGKMVNFITAPRTNIYGPFPPSTAFLTVTITSSPKVEPLPGDFDPSVAIHLSEAETTAERRAPPGSQLQQDLARRAYALLTQATHMRVGGSVAWWEMSQRTKKMGYECDANLGTPAAVDCTNIQTHQLGNLNETLEVGPGKTRFLSSKTCTLAISATETLMLTWQQVRSALDTLMSLCVIHPGLGGRAYHAPQPALSSRDRSKTTNIHDAYALPSRANITISRSLQNGSW